MNCLIAITFVLLLLPAGSSSSLERGFLSPVILVVWPDASSSSSAIYSAGDLECRHGRWNCQQRDDGPGDGPRTRYRAIDVAGSASLGRFEAHDIDAKVNADCIRAHADVVVVRRARCAMTGDPQVGRINMPFGLQVTSARTVLVEDSSFEGFQWRAPDFRFWNGEGVSIERGVGGQFRRVMANNNTDAGFDLKPFAIMSDVSAASNCRNFRFWSGGDAGTLTTGDVVKRGGTSSCSGIWLSGSQDGSRIRLHIKKLVVRMSRPAMIIEVENGPADVEIDECDIRAPAGSQMIRFENGAGEVRLGRGCQVARSELRGFSTKAHENAS